MNNFISPFPFISFCPWSLTPSPPGFLLSHHCFSPFSFFLFLSLFPFSFTQAVPCFVSHLETQAASNSNIFQQQVLAKALAATWSGPQTELCYWVNKGQLESWSDGHLSCLQRALKEWEITYWCFEVLQTRVYNTLGTHFIWTWTWYSCKKL